MMELLTLAWHRGQLTDLAFHFSGLIARLDPSAAEEVLLAAALVSQKSFLGETCLNLNDIAETPVLFDGDNRVVSAPVLSTWVSALRKSTAVGASNMRRPLVLETDNRLYLYRYRNLEERLAIILRSRAEAEDFPVDAVQMTRALNRVFPDPASPLEQKEAAALVLQRPLTVISGGPGTGKSSTVLCILALLKELDIVASDRIALSAPTGKAAARLQEAVGQASSRLELNDNSLNVRVVTLHRLLGWRRNGRRPIYGLTKKVPYDLVIVDEASMVGLSLMTQLLESLLPTCRLVLLGDQNQLSSVEAGTVFRDICRSAKAKPMADSVVVLKQSWRFPKESHIGRFAFSVNSGDTKAACKKLSDHGQSEVILRMMASTDDLSRLLEERCLNIFSERLTMVAQSAPLQEIIDTFYKVQLLTVQRSGIGGVNMLNRLITNQLSHRALIPTDAMFYPGRPILITQNKYDLELFNGDVGIVLADSKSNRLKTVFSRTKTEFLSVNSEQLPQHETMYAMTVHKSQGSEFEHVIVVLPPTTSPILSRALLYTAITRATSRIEIWGTKELLCSAINHNARHESGLEKRISHF
jgi:exodeoxyribonuclease V alpha subunit